MGTERGCNREAEMFALEGFGFYSWHPAEQDVLWGCLPVCRIACGQICLLKLSLTCPREGEAMRNVSSYLKALFRAT